MLLRENLFGRDFRILGALSFQVKKNAKEKCGEVNRTFNYSSIARYSGWND
jgi:hypothetical protein